MRKLKIDMFFVFTGHTQSHFSLHHLHIIWYNTDNKSFLRKGERIMKLDMDRIQFESRAEIGEIIRALEEWRDSHKEDKKRDTVQEFIDKLDTMSMCW